jgi:molecular chaperone GrpE (heat shock protein)
MKWLPSLRRDTPEEREPAGTAAEQPDFSPGPTNVAQAPSGSAEFSQAESPPVDRPPEPAESMISATPEGNSAASGTGEAAANAEAPSAQCAPGSTPPGETLALLEKVREELSGKQQLLCDDQRALNELFATRLRSDEAQARAVERLHDELRQYKTNFVRQQFLPLLKEVIFCHDFLTGQIERAAGEAAANGDAAKRPLVAARQMLTDLLFKYDVEPYRSEAIAFDPKLQQCTHTVPTDRNEADKTIAARGLEGFRSADGIVRREQVSVYKFTPGAD